MATVTLRPNANGSVSGWAYSPNQYLYLRDNDDSSGTHSDTNTSTLFMQFDDFSVPSNASVTSVRTRIRCNAYASGLTAHTGQYTVGAGDGNFEDISGVSVGASPPDPPTNIVTYSLTPRTTNPAGQPWSQADINSLQMSVSATASGLNNLFIYELYYDVVYNYAPTASSVSTSGSREDVTVSWSYSDTEGDAQNGRQVKIFTSAVVNGGGFNPDSSSNVFDSGQEASSSNSKTCDTNLSNGYYYAYVRVKDAGSNVWSPWVGGSEFRIINSPLMMM